MLVRALILLFQLLYLFSLKGIEFKLLNELGLLHVLSAKFYYMFEVSICMEVFPLTKNKGKLVYFQSYDRMYLQTYNYYTEFYRVLSICVAKKFDVLNFCFSLHHF